MLLLEIEKRHDKATTAKMLAISELVKGIKIFVFQVFVLEKKNKNRIKEFLGV